MKPETAEDAALAELEAASLVRNSDEVRSAAQNIVRIDEAIIAAKEAHQIRIEQMHETRNAANELVQKAEARYEAAVAGVRAAFLGERETYLSGAEIADENIAAAPVAEAAGLSLPPVSSHDGVMARPIEARDVADIPAGSGLPWSEASDQPDDCGPAEQQGEGAGNWAPRTNAPLHNE